MSNKKEVVAVTITAGLWIAGYTLNNSLSGWLYFAALPFILYAIKCEHRHWENGNNS